MLVITCQLKLFIDCEKLCRIGGFILCNLKSFAEQWPSNGSSSHHELKPLHISGCLIKFVRCVRFVKVYTRFHEPPPHEKDLKCSNHVTLRATGCSQREVTLPAKILVVREYVVLHRDQLPPSYNSSPRIVADRSNNRSNVRDWLSRMSHSGCFRKRYFNTHGLRVVLSASPMPRSRAGHSPICQLLQAYYNQTQKRSVPGDHPESTIS